MFYLHRGGILKKYCYPLPPSLPPPSLQHEDDVIEVRSLHMADTHAFVMMDDEVADVLEDKEVVSGREGGEGGREGGREELNQ